MKVSIVIPTFNEEKYLPKLLESIKNQSFKDYEIIVADGNSKDSSVKIAKQYGAKVVKGIGSPAVGRNNGAKVAKGDLLLFLDGDVVLPPNFLSKNTYEFYNRKLVCATTLYKPLSKKIILKIIFQIANIWDRLTQYFSPYAAGWCIFCTRDVFRRAGGFDEDVYMAEDHDFVKSCSKIGKFRVLKSEFILCSTRRWDREGYFRLIFKYVYATFYHIIKGKVDRPLFKYKMGG